MHDLAVSVENVSKRFCRSLKQGMLYTASDVLWETLGSSRGDMALRKGEFWATNDVSLELRQGDCLGLIGGNGAGKSTLLKLLNGIFRPDKGQIRMRGRIGALIEVGAGFHPMLTGWENIYVNGSILGMSKREIDSKIDNIIEFSGLSASVLDAPVKSYSSGMYVRLGFAIAANSYPDIMLVDEILAVGDIEFQSRCWQYIHELRQRGTVIILVSHSSLTIREVCDTALWMESGRVKQMGGVDEVVDNYEQSVATQLDSDPTADSATALPGYNLSLQFLSGVGKPMDRVLAGDPLTAEMVVETPESIERLHLLLEFHAVGKPFYASYCTEWDGLELTSVAHSPNRYQVHFPNFNLPVGEYRVSVVAAKESIINHCVWSYGQYKLKVDSKSRLRGDMDCAHVWKSCN